MNGNLVVPADFKSVVPVRKAREVGSIPTRPRKMSGSPCREIDVQIDVQKLMCRSQGYY